MEPKSVGIVILGAGGYMGSTAIRALKYLVPELVASDIRLRFLCLAEPFEDKRNDAISLCSTCTEQSVTPANKLPEALLHLEGARIEEKYPVLIYDATPTTFHHDNLVDLHQHNDSTLFYLGEKPIFTDEFEQKFVTHNTGEEFEFFCELIETENPVFLAVRDFLTAKDLKLTNISLWRAGCSGIKKAISISRSGVEGGALEDKSLHDFSISVGLLGRGNIRGAEITNSTIHSLILHSDHYFKGDERVFLDVCNHATHEIVTNLKKAELLPADGLLSMDVSWKLDDRFVPAKYLFSWIGFNEQEPEQQFVSDLTRLGFPVMPTEMQFPDLDVRPRKWLDISDPFRYTTQSEVFEAKMHEIRAGVFRFESTDGAEAHLVCNFLSKYGVRRYAYVVQNVENTPTITETLFVDPVETLDYDENKSKDLSRILRNVIDHAVGFRKAELIDRETTLLVHDLLIRGRQQALAHLSKDAKHWFDIAEPIFKSNITKYPL